jgi:subtilisin family serine protease
VDVILPEPPRRRTAAEMDDRRPVVAVLDTGIAPHPWFGLPDRTNPPPAGGFLAVAPVVQDAILQAQLATGITVPTQLLNDHWDAPSTDEPLIGDIDTDTGHGIFIAGVLRQASPDVDTLAIRCVHSDGVAYEADVLLALTMLAARVQAAQQNQQPEDMIDVLTLSLGYFDETPADAAYTSQLSAVLAELTGLGVVVLAAAGNSATSRRFYPAAFADQPPVSGGGPQVISVGALNPNGSKALFSNEAPWVQAWATGAGVVSTYPTDVHGSSAADHELPDQNRNGLDPDDYSSGFAVWDGTSFATPLAAAALANALISVAANDSALGLLSVDQTTAVKRAWAALALV